MPEIYLLIDGERAGPYTEEQVREFLDNGQVSGETQAWQEGLVDWVNAADIPKQNEKQNVEEEIDDAADRSCSSAETVAPFHAAPSKVKNRNLALRYFGIASAFAAGLVILGVSFGMGVGLVLPHSTQTSSETKPTAPSVPDSQPSETPVSLSQDWISNAVPTNDVTEISYDKLWITTDVYQNTLFAYSGVLGTPYWEDYHALDSTHYKVLIKGSTDQDSSQNNLILGFISKEKAAPLVDAVSQNGDFKTTGCFLLKVIYVQEDIVNDSIDKVTRDGRDNRYVFCEILGFAPNFSSLQKLLSANVQGQPSSLVSFNNQQDSGYVPTMSEAIDRGHHSGASTCILKPDMTESDIESCAESQAPDFGYVGDLRTAFIDSFKKGYEDQLQKQNNN